MGPKDPAYLLLDVGGTYIKSAVFSKDGDLWKNAETIHSTHSDATADQILAGLGEVISQACMQIANKDKVLGGIGLSFPGPFNYFTGISMMKHKFQSLYGISILDYLRSLPDVNKDIPVVFGHDANSALEGEMWKGAARGHEQVAMVTLGTGLGFAYAQQGQVQANETGGPGLSVYSRPYRDGILEDYVSRRACLRRYEELVKSPFLLEVVDIADRARTGDEYARQTFEEMAEALAEGIRPILLEKAITCLVVGGQISKSFDIFGSTLRNALENLPQLSQIVPAQHFSNAALLGILKKLRTLSIKTEM